MAKSKIEWTERAWNPVKGCSKVSAGCKNCYAERMAARFCGENQPYHGLIRNGKWTGEARFVPEMLAAPLRWKKPSLVFVNSMSDLFHESITFEQIAAVHGVIAACPWHTFQVLTKRAERMVEFYEWYQGTSGAGAESYSAVMQAVSMVDTDANSSRDWFETGKRAKWPLSNLHLGVSVENQETANERIPRLLECPASVRWISAEPLLGPVDLNSIDSTRAGWIPVNGASGITSAFARWQTHPMRAKLSSGIDWVVAGGESGPNARPVHPEWARSLRDQCKAANVPFWFKQWGEWLPRSACYHIQSDGKSLAEKDPDCARWPCVKMTGLGNDGSRLENSLDTGDVVYMQRVGKKTAGNLLDGVRYEMKPGDKWT